MDPQSPQSSSPICFPPNYPKMYSPDVEVPTGKKGGQGVILETLNEFQEPYPVHDKELDKVMHSKPALYEKGLNAPQTDWYTDCAPHGVLNEFDRLFYVNGFGWIPVEKMEKIHDAYDFLLSGEFTPQHVFVVRGGTVGDLSYNVSEVTAENSQVQVQTKNKVYNMLPSKASRPSFPCPEGIKSPSPSCPSYYTGTTIQNSEWNSGMFQSTEPVEQDPVGEETMDDADSQPLE